MKKDSNMINMSKRLVRNYTSNRNRGFTLSEVLIALVIIGVIAAITIPSIQKQYLRVVTATRLKHTYSVVSQMIKLAEAKYGMMESWGLENYGGMSSDGGGSEMYDRYINTYMMPFLVNAKYNSSFTSMRDIGYKNSILYPDGSVYKNIDYSYRFVTLGNGVTLSPGIYSRKINDNQYYVINIQFSVDIDGPQKGPNMVGKDVFVIEQIFQNGRPITMYGETIRTWDEANQQYTYDKETTRKNALKYCKKGNSNSLYCGMLIKADGWEIKKDYPWL